MREIDPGTWARRDHFRTYAAFADPLFDLCAPVDVTLLRDAARTAGAPLTAAIVFVLAAAANRLAPFRWRIRGDRVVEHEVVHPAMTVPTGEDLFGFCFFDYVDEAGRFLAHARKRIADARAHPSLENPDRDDLLFMTAIPWVAFTAFSHPSPARPPDSIPRFAWGRITEREGRSVMPLEVRVHHALMDGLHLGRYFETVQSILDTADAVLSGTSPPQANGRSPRA